MNTIYNFMYALGMFCVLILAIHGFINLVENQNNNVKYPLHMINKLMYL